MSSAALSQNTGPFAVGVSGLTAATDVHLPGVRDQRPRHGLQRHDELRRAPPNQAPTANAGGPYTANEGSSLTLSGSGTDANGDPLTYTWDINGDGTYGDATGASPTLTARRATHSASTTGPRRSTSACASPTAGTRRRRPPPP